MGGFKRNSAGLVKFIRFGAVGVVNTLIDQGIYAALLWLSPFFTANLWAAKLISYSCGVANSFFMNRSFTFKTKTKPLSADGLKFLLINAATLAAGTGIIYLAGALINFGAASGERPVGVLKNIISAPFTVTINFLLSKALVFEKKGKYEPKN